MYMALDVDTTKRNNRQHTTKQIPMNWLPMITANLSFNIVANLRHDTQSTIFSFASRPGIIFQANIREKRSQGPPHRSNLFFMT